MQILQVKRLTKIYGDRRAVNDVSFSVNAGEIFGFLGANGAGKSTTLKMITGLANITAGDVSIMGYSVKYKFEKAISKIGAIIEYPQFYESMSGYQNLKFLAKISDVKKERIDEVINLVGLKQRIKDPVKKYSLGMKQRLGIAQALLNKPKLLVLDEPTNGLDANAIRELRIFLKTLAQTENVAIIVSSHILPEMENLCDRIAIINKGKLVEIKTMQEIKKIANRYGSTFIKTNAPDFAGVIIKREYNLPVKIQDDKILLEVSEDILSKIIYSLTKNKIQIFGAGEVETSLEDVFMTTLNEINSSSSID